MTKDELNQVFYIEKEIKMWEDVRKLNRFKSSIKSPIIDGLPHGTDISDSTGNIGAKNADIEIIINELQDRARQQRLKILNYMRTIKDSQMRQIICKRHCLCMKWSQVAREIGGGNTAEGIRKAHDRFLQYEQK